MNSKLSLFIVVFTVLLSISAVSSAELSRDEQIRIIEDYLFVSGQAAQPSAATADEIATSGNGMPIKCGMSAAADFAMNRSRLDRDLLVSLGVQLNTRPVLQSSYKSPSGRFLIHYSKTGSDAVYQASSDSDGDGVPNYVEATALIADSVYVHEIDTLGYPVPPSDSFYTAGTDSAAYDIYIVDLPPSFYGLAYPDSVYLVSPSHYQSTSFIKLDNDYSQLPGYQNRPLDAIRVTMAHEYFHAIQFGIDPFESENFDQSLQKRYWMEISSVWMEEEVYDNINDYYGYLPYFFEDVTVSIQQFNSFSDLHPYGAGIFGMFLSQRFGRDLMRSTWLKCGEYGIGPHALLALDQVIDSISDSTSSLASAFAEFAQWNYFTGFRTGLAPNGATYEEAEEYPEIPDEFLNRNSNFQILPANIKTLLPEHMAAAYFRFEGGLGVQYQIFAADTVRIDSLRVDPDTICNLVILDSLFDDTVPQRYRGTTQIPYDWALAACPDLQPQPDTCAILNNGCTSYTRAIFDSTFNVTISLDTLPSPWYLSTVYQLRNMPDSHEIESFAVPAPRGTALITQTANPEQFCSYLVIVTPATSSYQTYRNGRAIPVKYLVNETPDPAFRSNCFGDTSQIITRKAELIAYPNPSVVTNMSKEEVRFRFRLEAADGALPFCADPAMTVDLYTTAGEHLASMQQTVSLIFVDQNHQVTSNEPVWNMSNASGAKVSSGVYIAVARLYCDKSMKQLLAENSVKVALIR